MTGILTKQIRAEDKIIFDSTDNYLGGCQMTNTSEWELTKDLNVSKFQIWYKWNAGEIKLPVKVFLNGEKFAEFDTARSACDPYQQTWCNGDYQINKLFPKGKYTTEVADRRQCLKPNGTGTIRLYENDVTPVESKLTSTAPIEPTIITAARPSVCSCNQTVVIVTAAVTSVISAAIVAFLLRR